MVFPAGQRFALLWIYLVRMLSCFVNILKHFFLFIRSSFSVQVPLSCKPLIGTSFPDSSGLSDDFLDKGIHYMHHEQFTNMGISLFVSCSLVQVSVVLVVKIPTLYHARAFRLLQVYHTVCIPASFNSYTCTN